MSTATARSPASAASAASAASTASRPPSTSVRTPAGHRLAVVAPTPARAPRAPFVMLLGALLTAGLAGLLFLHTALAEGSFRLHDLQNRSATLADREQALEQEVARVASPRRLAARAEALGMVRSVNPAFIRLSDGRVLGRPRPGVAKVAKVAKVVPTVPTVEPVEPGAEVAEPPSEIDR